MEADYDVCCFWLYTSYFINSILRTSINVYPTIIWILKYFYKEIVKMSKTLLLNQQELKELINMKDVVDLVDKTFYDMGLDKTVNPTKVLLDLGETADYPPY